ncbi:MAG: NAD(P)/FAD-dependent oxidoreductase [Thermoanaerobaculia bacterium]|nr:NAD(P)/FAD-dependent oxidoreductase [Thermoanaerobaculia bacterium]
MRVGVIGAGPAAGAAARELASAGCDVTVFRPGRPGEKPCGGAFPDHLLERLHGFDASRLPAVVAPSALLENGAGQQLTLDLRGLRIVRRADFDPALETSARSLGAAVVEHKAERLGWQRGRPTIEAAGRRYRFDWLIGADGARGLSRRALGLVGCGESVGLGASLSDVEVERLVLAFPELGDAYLWVFPRPGGCSVGIAYTAGTVSDGAASACLRRFVRRQLGRPLADLPGPRYRYPIPVYGEATVEAISAGVGHRILLVGDAAAVADPLTREGIRYAVLSGQTAARSLIDEEPESYGEQLRGEIEADLGRALRARELFFEDPIGRWMVPVCRRHPGIRRVLSDLLACRQPYVGLRGRLVAASLDLAGTTAAAT